ncbi:MAG: asparagine synthetase B [Candidatus Cloacimonetes bacterium]|nr:asparagine synthetase B [Candidatus Cloacimonadota bacterium]
MRICVITITFLMLLFSALNSQLLIPMDQVQTDHLKAYGIAFEALKQDIEVRWLLNYRGGSFLMYEETFISNLCRVRGVYYERVSGANIQEIFSIIAENNMEVIVLEKEPKIAVYIPDHINPWSDAVSNVLRYAEIEFERVWDEEVLRGDLAEYDWLHLHHEDFTGQYGKFYGSFRNAPWYIEEVRISQEMATKLGFRAVWQMKHEVAERIRQFVVNGGFLFAMCGAPETIDIALAAYGVDIVEEAFDGTPKDPNYITKLDFTRTFAFENFSLITSPFIYAFSNIDASDYVQLRGREADFFQLFSFSAKFDPVPTMLVQNHTNVVDGFMGQSTAFTEEFIKRSVIILGKTPNIDVAKYIHGNVGMGTFTFLGGHDPEDYTHRVGDPSPVIALHKNSPGYRLILNNVLFPAAEKRPLKTKFGGSDELYTKF